MTSRSPDNGRKKALEESDRIHGAVKEAIIACLILILPMVALTAVFLGLVYAKLIRDRSLDSPLALLLPPSLSSGSAYLVNYSATRLITVSSWTSTATTLIMPSAMVLLSFPIARSLRKSSAQEEHADLPSPYQLNLIIGMLGGGFSSLWQFTMYTFWRGKHRNPKIVTITASVLGIFTILGWASLFE